jgi:plasmid stabilization system protein ParE
MASKLVSFHPDAEQEYLTSLAWYRQRSLTAAINFEEEFFRAIVKIAEAPDRWPSYTLACRRYVLHQFPFSIVYRVNPSQVDILALAHGHRRPGYWRERLGWKSESGL